MTSSSTKMEEREIPPHFLCPISLQLMRDPVTIPTGITYDREHIERWVFTSKIATCPVTKQPLMVDRDIMTPNHTLRRLINSWCTLNRIPTPTDYQPSTVDSRQILNLLDDAREKTRELQYTCLQKIKSLLMSDERTKKVLEISGGFMNIASIIMSENGAAKEEALSILAQLDPPKTEINALLRNDNDPFIDTLMGFSRSGSSETREHAIRVLKSIYDVMEPNQLANAKCELFTEIIKPIKDESATTIARKQALKLLIGLNPWGRNRVKAVGSGAVSALVELLVDVFDRRVCELALMVLDQLCGCAEGRADLMSHGVGLAAVSKKILRVSNVATDRAVRILSSISKHSATGRVVGEMVEVGVVSMLCLVVQVDCRAKTKERAKEILRLHSRVWRNSPCIPSHLLSSYPSS